MSLLRSSKATKTYWPISAQGTSWLSPKKSEESAPCICYFTMCCYVEGVTWNIMLDHSLGETAEENEEVDAPHAIGTGTQHKLVKWS